jgi:hypothetical protein
MTIGDAFGPGERQPQLRGVSGWLLFLCIVLMVFLPIPTRIFHLGGAGLASGVHAVRLFFITLILVPSAIGITAGVLLYREQPLGLTFARLFFGLQIVVAVTAFIFRPVLSEVLLAVVPAGAWLAYLFRSERVRNTYFKDTRRDAAEVFR